MKFGNSVIAEYFFHPSQTEAIDELLPYKRFIQINNEERHPGLAIKAIDYESFATGVKPNEDFSFGSRRIIVNTNDFANISSDCIIAQIKDICEKITG